MTKTIEIPEGYEAALERCKQWVAGTSGLNPGASPKEVSEYIFPELAESENERIREVIESIVRVYGKTQGEWLAGYDMDTLVVHLRDAFACLERQKEQQPAEWSEEDKMHLNNAILAAEKEWGAESRTAKFLKSLRPQPHQTVEDKSISEEILEYFNEKKDYRSRWYVWVKYASRNPHWKPSEEQMKALNEVANNGVLLDLFNDLLKLL